MLKTAKGQVLALLLLPSQNRCPPGERGQLRPLTRRNTESKEGPELLLEIVIQVSGNMGV